MTSIYRPQANEISINSTANSVGNNRLIRVLNNTGGDVLINVVNNGVNVTSITVMSGAEMFIHKHRMDGICANTTANSVLVVPVAFEST